MKIQLDKYSFKFNKGDDYSLNIKFNASSLEIIDSIKFVCNELGICEEMTLLDDTFVYLFNNADTINYEAKQYTYDIEITTIDGKKYSKTQDFGNKLIFTVCPRNNPCSE